MTRNTRGLTRSVIALMVPPLPAPSRPSNTTLTLRPLCLTHSCSLTSSTCSLASSLSYCLRFSPSAFLPLPAPLSLAMCFLPPGCVLLQSCAPAVLPGEPHDAEVLAIAHRNALAHVELERVLAVPRIGIGQAE